MDIFRFWGKAQPINDEGPGWHPLVYHSLDVAAVGEALLDMERGPGTQLSLLCGRPLGEIKSTVLFLLALHDVGKFAKKFQAKVPKLFPDCFPDDPYNLATSYDHGAGGLRLFDADSSAFTPSGDASIWRPLVSAVTGHHGRPPAPPMAPESLVSLRADFGKPGINAANAFIESIRDLFRPPEDLTLSDSKRVRPASFAVAGLAVLADWVGSKQEWFPYQDPDPGEDLDVYLKGAKERARNAIDKAGLRAATPGSHLAYSDLIGSDMQPSPMQKWARDVELPAGPALFLIEDETGSGKTEAALMLAHRLMKQGSGSGLHIALPTMATANAMFDRMADAHRHLFTDDVRPSVALAHGASSMHRGFRSATLRAGRDEKPYSDSGDSETTASAACAEWIADDRRRAFLADVGACTVDQALLAILPSRHQSLRLLGLMQRVLILDEIHAYDAFMQREIEALLEFQAGLGGSVILLSATLPVSTRKRLTDAFARGLGEEAHNEPPGMDYPLATVRSAARYTQTPISGRGGHGRNLPVRFLRSPDEALDEVERAATDGKAVLYIRNTVQDALDAYEELAQRNIHVDLFHSRFALADRLEIENRIVNTFGKGGKDSTTTDRESKVLVATQVVEQSLDLDFDAMITDLAPVDLLIQRAGRLWRHQRKERQGQPELLVVAPKPVPDADKKWFGGLFQRGAFVYRDHARLWLTARTLEKTGSIDSPKGLRHLIEAVYGEEAETTLPDELHDKYWEAEGEAGAERGVANTNVLHLSKGYVRDGGVWDSDIRTPTRLNDDPQRKLRLAVVRDGQIEPYAGSTEPDEPWRAWRLSEVSVSARRVDDHATSELPPEWRAAVERIVSEWKPFEQKECILALLFDEADGNVLSGCVRKEGKIVRIDYDRSRGLHFPSIHL